MSQEQLPIRLNRRKIGNYSTSIIQDTTYHFKNQIIIMLFGILSCQKSTQNPIKCTFRFQQYFHTYLNINDLRNIDCTFYF